MGWLEKYEDGGKAKNIQIPEVTVYGKAKYNKLLAENEVKKAKFLADMGKYKKDSTEWVKANKGYQDSLKLYNTYSKHFENLKPLTNESTLVGQKRSIKQATDEWDAAFKEDVDKINKNIKPIGYRGNNNGTADWVSAIFKNPTNKPIQPTPPSDSTSTIKYDPKYESLQMRSLWANKAKQDTTAKVGVLNPLDYNDESKGFTVGQAFKFPQEVKDEFGLNYIDSNILKKQNGGELKKINNFTTKQPNWLDKYK